MSIRLLKDDELNQLRDVMRAAIRHIETYNEIIAAPSLCYESEHYEWQAELSVFMDAVEGIRRDMCN